MPLYSKSRNISFVCKVSDFNARTQSYCYNPVQNTFQQQPDSLSPVCCAKLLTGKETPDLRVLLLLSLLASMLSWIRVAVAANACPLLFSAALFFCVVTYLFYVLSALCARFDVPATSSAVYKTMMKGLTVTLLDWQTLQLLPASLASLLTSLRLLDQSWSLLK